MSPDWQPEYVRIELPLSALRCVQAVPRYWSRLEWLRQNFERAMPIPLRFGKRGELELDGDGNHRLCAARALGLETVTAVVRFRFRALAERQLRRALRARA